LNKFNPKKLLNSKWTAVHPTNKEKHFLVTKVSYDENGDVILCKLEAVFSKRVAAINWKELTRADKWKQGWK